MLEIKDNNCYLLQLKDDKEICKGLITPINPKTLPRHLRDHVDIQPKEGVEHNLSRIWEEVQDGLLGDVRHPWVEVDHSQSASVLVFSPIFEAFYSFCIQLLKYKYINPTCSFRHFF